MATASSYFSGSTLMPSQLPAAAAPAASPSPSKSRVSRYAVPVTVRQIARALAAAAAADGDLVLSIDGVETNNVRVLGIVVNMVDRETDVSFTLDDGTGKIALERWITEPSDTLDVANVQNGAYVRVHVNLKGFQAKRPAHAYAIRPITNFNEVVLHFIECCHVHLENVRQKMPRRLLPAVQTNPSIGASFSGGLPPAVQTNPSIGASFSGGLPHAVQTSPCIGASFSGGVREHQVHFTSQVNQFSAYLGTGGKRNDLQRMVLEVFQEPAILVLENGIHIDEVARRLGMLKTNILEVIRNLVDVGLIYSTIDDNHFKSICNG